jgi:hypothetical protein
MRTLLALHSIAFALVLVAACSSSGGGANGTVPLNGNCNQDSDCAPVAGQQIQCLCSPTGTDQNAQCIALLQAGASCESASPFQTPCASGLYCGLSAAGTGTAVCVAYAESGQSCATVSCDVGLACQPNTQTCGAQFAIGASCTADNDCAGTALCSDLVCTAPSAIGQSCFGFTPAPGDTSGEKNPCVAGANCVAGTCAQAVANGGACTTSEQCASGLCEVPSSGPPGTCQSISSGGDSVQLCAR